MTRLVKLSVVVVSVVLVAGCGGGLSSSRQTSRQQPSIRGTSFPQQLEPAGQVSVEEIDDYHGWQALRMENGLVTIVAVPAIGGRIMEYKLGDHPFLWTNPAQWGNVYQPPQSEEERQWHNFGGYKVWPAPQEKWGGAPDPLGSSLDGGKWDGQVTMSGGEIGEIELVSPADEEVTGLQITRRIQMFAGTTRVMITETFKNVSDEEISWSIWGVTQVPGSLSSRENYSEEARIYLPLNPESRVPERFWYLTGGDSEQFQTIDDGRLMEVSYRHETAKIGADVMAGWIAYSDGIHEYAFVQRFAAHKLRDYPDQGATAEVFTAGGALAYMEMQLLSPLHTLQPGEQVSFDHQWYATSLAGPIRQTSQVAAIREPLQLEDVEEGLRLTGEFGAFASGQVEIILLDQAGEVVEEVTSITASPAQAVVVNEVVSATAGATAVALRLVNDRGTPLGVVAELPLETQTAQAP